MYNKLIISECLLALQLRRAVICLKTTNFQVEISRDQHRNLLTSFSAKAKSYLTN